MALLCWYAERRAAVKGAPFFDAAKRTLEGEDPLCENFAGRNGYRPPGALADRAFGLFAYYRVERATAEKPRRPMRCSAEPPDGELSSSQAGRFFKMH